MTIAESARLALREFQADDFEALHGFVSDPVVCRYTDWGPNTVSDTEAFLAEAAAEAFSDARTSYSLAVTRKSDSRLVGSCAVWRESAMHARGALGFVFDPTVWNQGYATETAFMLQRIGYERLGLRRIEATCRPDNVASRRALQKSGLEVEGLLRGHVLIRGARQDSLVLGILLDEA